jgi:hypothetical protein
MSGVISRRLSWFAEAPSADILRAVIKLRQRSRAWRLRQPATGITAVANVYNATQKEP